MDKADIAEGVRVYYCGVYEHLIGKEGTAKGPVDPFGMVTVVFDEPIKYMSHPKRKTHEVLWVSLDLATNKPPAKRSRKKAS